jgi:ABC-2 type transport system ATP-binding protein
MPMLEIAGLRKTFRNFSLGPIDLQLEPGSAHALIGPSGSGKTTLFRCVMGTVRRDQGLVKVGGRVADGTSGDWKKGIGYVGDYTPFFDHLSGARNLTLLSTYYDRWSSGTAESLASRFDLDLAETVKAYSTGQRAKLALVAALAHHPTLLLLDEPTNGLDPVVRDVFMEVLYERMQHEEFTLLYATHHVSETERLADRLILLDSGQILRHDVKDDLLRNWRRITFNLAGSFGAVPNQVAVMHDGDDCAVVTTDYQETVRFLEQSGAGSVRVAQLSVEDICVHILKNRLRSRR